MMRKHMLKNECNADYQFGFGFLFFDRSWQRAAGIRKKIPPTIP